LRRTFVYQLISTFFGLTSDYRLYLFKQIHEIVFHGKGGYDWHTVYNMPIWLRKFTFKLMLDHYDEENKSNSSGGDSSSTEIDFNNPLAAAQTYRQNVRK